MRRPLMGPTVHLNASRAWLNRPLAAVAILLTALAAGFLARSGLSPAAAGTSAQPNIVFILTDDQTRNSFRPDVMPRTFSRVVTPGTRFDQALATPPLCCPYRAGFLTGQHVHNHGVTMNKSGYSLLRRPENVLPEWFRQAGYETALVGKFLNGSTRVLGADAAPGWDEWYAADLSSGFVDPEIATEGAFETVPGYLTDVLTDRAVEYIEDSAAAPDPFFLWLSHVAPHRNPSTTAFCPSTASQPTAEDYLAFNGPSFAEVRSPSFNEADISDKPPRIRRRPRLMADQVAVIRNRWQCAVAALASVDRGVDRVLDALQQTGELNNTVVVFGSDNGMFFGEHRLRAGKGEVYDEAWRVPFAMRVPVGVLGGPATGTVSELVTQQDLAATLLELADATPCISPSKCRRLDGRSFADLLRGDADDWPTRKILYELWPACDRKALGVRTDRYAYVQRAPECGGGAEELYDRYSDPFELRNLAEARPSVAKRLFRLAKKQRRCTGVAGRDEPLERGPFCR
jgi:N-acetylglucosamine-6-sulfatase